MMPGLTIRHPGEGGHKVVLTDDGETDEHVGGHQDVEEEAAPLPGGLVQDGGRELVDSRRHAALGRPVDVRPHLHPGHGLRPGGDGGLRQSGVLIVGLTLLLLAQSQQASCWDWRETCQDKCHNISVLHFLCSVQSREDVREEMKVQNTNPANTNSALLTGFNWKMRGQNLNFCLVKDVPGISCSAVSCCSWCPLSPPAL